MGEKSPDQQKKSPEETKPYKLQREELEKELEAPLTNRAVKVAGEFVLGKAKEFGIENPEIAPQLVITNNKELYAKTPETAGKLTLFLGFLEHAKRFPKKFPGNENLTQEKIHYLVVFNVAGDKKRSDGTIERMEDKLGVALSWNSEVVGLAE